MKPLLIVALISASPLFLEGCTVSRPFYYPGYKNDYVYSVGYYGYRPYWGSRYSGWEDDNYWMAHRGVYAKGFPQAWYGYVSRW